MRRLGCDAIRRHVDAQGVARPFRILVRMPEQSRLALGSLLDCAVVAGDAPETQAWRLINQNLRGLQARTHRIHETLSPFARNNDWWEIVTRTARRLGLRCHAGMKDEEVERLLFDHLAAEFLRLHGLDGADQERYLGELHPNLGRAIASLGLSRAGQHALVVTLLRAAADPQTGFGDPREGSNRLADRLRKAMPWTWATSIGTGLRFLQQRLCDICLAWTRLPPRISGDNYARVGIALMVIHLQDVVERTQEQFDLIGG